MVAESVLEEFDPDGKKHNRLWSTTKELEVALETLTENKTSWLNVSIEEKIKFLEEAIYNFGNILNEWVKLNLEAKDALNDPYAAGLEWIGGPVAVLRYLQGLRHGLIDIKERGVPKFPGPVSELPDGQVVAQIYPSTLYERIVTPGVTAAVWMEHGVTKENLSETQAAAYKHKQGKGSLVLVLGGGNVAGIPVNDSMTKLFVENKVVILKMNPVNEYLGPLIEKCFEDLITYGYFQVVYGGAVEGNYLCHHPKVDEIHMTGSDRTFDVIAFGSGEEGRQRKQARNPIINKPFTSELGSVAPAIIVPGPWRSSDLDYQAEQLASHLCDNASFSCSRTRVILNHSGWSLRDKFLASLRSVMGKIPLRTAYYPGANDLYETFVSAHPGREEFGNPGEFQLPWTLVAEVDSNQKNDICFTTESFCPVIAETSLDADNIPDFIDKAVDFSNNILWGTLSATIIVHPQSLKDSEISAAFERAVKNLRVGQVVVNGIPGMAWVMTTPPWGSFPGNEIQDIQSGVGFVHNVYMFSRPQKTVVRCPFVMWPKPLWFNSRAQTYKNVTRKIADYDLKPSLWKIPGIVLAALRN